jgi:glycosyltransferase involved in cell wall biosynthesis
VLTSNVTSLPEIAGDAALVVDPFDVAAMAAAIKRLDSDVDLLDELSRRGREQARIYSMDNYVSRLAGVYRSILGGLPGGADTPAG